MCKPEVTNIFMFDLMGLNPSRLSRPVHCMNHPSDLGVTSDRSYDEVSILQYKVGLYSILH